MATPSFESLTGDVNSLRSDIKSLSKLVRKLIQKHEDPDGEKAKARSANNGFNRPLVITSELRSFLGLGADEMISRSNVTKQINKYITAEGLKHPDNGRVIIMDDKLSSLLKPPEDVQVTFLNIQKYLSPHYIKQTKEDATESVADSATTTETEVTSTKKAAAPKRPTVRKPKA